MAFRNLNTEFIVKNNNLLDPDLPVYNITKLQSIPINPNVEEFDVLQYDSTSNQWNTTVDPSVTGSSNPYLCTLLKGLQVIPTAVNTQITFDITRIDTSGGTMPDLSNHQVVIQKDGKYFIFAGPFFMFDSGVGNTRRIQIQKNSVVISENTKDASSVPYRVGFWTSIVSQCVVGDIIQVFSYQDSGADRSVTNQFVGSQTQLGVVYFGD